MCHKIRCDGESWKLFGFQGELNKAKATTSERALGSNTTTQHRQDSIELCLMRPFWCEHFDLCSMISHVRGGRRSTVLEGQGQGSSPQQACQFIGNPCLRTSRAKATRISTTTQRLHFSWFLKKKCNWRHTTLFLDACAYPSGPVKEKKLKVNR